MTASLLTAENLTFAYRDVPVLRDVSIELAAGEVVALLGPNGSGKSTLLRVLLGQLHCAGGSIAWDGKSLNDWRRRDLARAVAYLPQSPTADESQSVHDVLRLGRSPYWGAFGLESAGDEKIVADVAQRLDLTSLLHRLVGELSGGQRQRVFLGRCLVQEPRALLLDEPGTFLDLRHQVEIGRLLKSLSREHKVGVLMASHDLNLAASLSDRMVLLSEGTIVAEGGADVVLDPQVLQNAYGIEMERVTRRNGVGILPVTDNGPSTAQIGDRFLVPSPGTPGEG